MVVKSGKVFLFYRFILFLFIFCVQLFFFCGDVSAQSADSIEQARDRARSIYSDFGRTVSNPGELRSWWIQPLTGHNTLRTLNGTKYIGNYTLLCRGDRKFLEISVIPTNSTGDLEVYVKWSPDEQGNLRKELILRNVSAPCGNGYISCTSPNSLGNCTYWLIGYDSGKDEFFASNTTVVRVPVDNGTVPNPQKQDRDRAFVNATREETVSVGRAHMAAPCVCVKNVCSQGGNAFAKAPEYILSLIGSAFVSALLKEHPDFIVTSTSIEGYKITYYGQSQKECNQTDVYSGDKVKRLSSYMDNSEFLDSDATSMYTSLSTDRNSPVYPLNLRVQELLSNNSYEYPTCTVKVQVSLNTYGVSDLKATYGGSGHCPRLQDAVFQSCPGSTDNKCFMVKAGVSQLGGGTITFQLFPDFVDSIERVVVEWAAKADAGNASELFDDDICVTLNGLKIKDATGDSLTEGSVDITSFFINASSSKIPLSSSVYYCGDKGGYPEKCVFLTFKFYLKQPLSGCYITGITVKNDCTHFENNPDCELWYEFYIPITNPYVKVPLRIKGDPTELKPSSEAVEFCPGLIIERDDWAFERTYRCKPKSNESYDYMKRYETIRGTIDFSASNGTITFTDIRKFSNSTDWITFPGQIMKVITGGDGETCIPVCKVKRPHKTREVEENMEARGYAKTREFEFSFRQCIMNSSGNYTCPYSPDKEEQIITDCTCDDTGFKEAIWTLQALRSAANDIFCQKKK